MELSNNLTYLQKTALEGEIAYILSSSPHNAEVRFRIYAVLSEIDEEDRPFAIPIIKEQVKFDESVVDRIVLEVESGEFPVWLWIEKTIADLKESLNFSDTANSPKIDIEKVMCRKKLINSSFVVLARKVLVVNPEVLMELCKEITEYPELQFLNSTCFYMIQWCSELKKVNKGVKNNEALKECLYDIRERMSYQLENQALSVFSKPSNRKIPGQSAMPNIQDMGTISIDMSEHRGITQEELSNFLSQKITELFEQSSPEPEKKKNSTFIVRKVFNNAQGQEVILKECKTEKEAEQFVKQIEENFPELLKTCSFVISENRKGTSK